MVGYGWTPQGYFEENVRATPLDLLPSDVLTRVLNSGGLRVLLTSSSWPLAGTIATEHSIFTHPEEFDYEGTTPGLPVVDLKIGPLRDEL